MAALRRAAGGTLILAGMMALFLSTTAGLEFVRIVAVGLLFAGAAALGVSSGLRSPLPTLAGGYWIRVACCLAAVALTAPVLVALAAAVIRSARAANGIANGLAALVLLAAGAGALVVGCRAVLLPVAAQAKEPDRARP